MASDSVKVAVRVRPFNQREKIAGSKCILSVTSRMTTIKHPDTGEPRTFTFDHSYWSHDGFTEDASGLFTQQDPAYADQKRVYSDLGQGVLDNAWQGYNAALFAYGQTGSGKSYSMLGYGVNKGIVPLTCDQLFKALAENQDSSKQFQVTFSMLEIYYEQVRDLLSSGKQPAGGLRVRQHPKTGFYVESLTRVPVNRYDEIEKLMAHGTLNRTTASTNMNASSSRSHMIITINFKQIFKKDSGESTTRASDIHLVDLAGSERANATGATGDRLKEGSLINQSLSCLGQVISALASIANGKKKVIIPYRDSILTKLLQSALGGNSRTIMIAALSPAAINYDETLSTLRYADRAKQIKNKATVNESLTDKLIRELKEENATLLAQLRGANTKKVEELEQLLAQNQAELEQIQINWQQRLEEAQTSWTRDRSDSDVTLQRQPFLQNVNEDPQLSGVIKLRLEQGSNIIGKSEEESVIRVRGLGIHDRHAVFTVSSTSVFLEPMAPTAPVVINGQPIKAKRELKHHDRVKLGSNSLYLFIGLPSQRTSEDSGDKYDYAYFQTELAEAVGFNASYLQSGGEKESREEVDRATQAVFEDYIALLPRLHEANAMSDEMKKDVSFEARVKNLTSHDAQGHSMPKEVIVKVTNNATSKVWVWSKEKFINRKFLIEDVYQKWAAGEDVTLEQSKDPFWDPVEDIYLGSCHVWLNSIAYCMDSDEFLEVRNHHGKEVANLHVRLVPCDAGGNAFKEEMIVFDPRELLNKRIDFMVSIPQCSDVAWIQQYELRGVYVKFSFLDQQKEVVTKTVWHSLSPALNFSKHLTIERVTEHVLDYLSSSAIVVELWGTQESESSSSKRKINREKLHVKLPDEHHPNQNKTIEELKAKLKLQEDELSRLRGRRDNIRRVSGKFDALPIKAPPVARKSSTVSSMTITPLPALPAGSQRRPSNVSIGASSRRLSQSSLSRSPYPLSDSPGDILPDIVPFSPVFSPPGSHTPRGSISDTPPRERLHSRETAPQDSNQPNLDVEMAKALKVFFRDIKSVQKKLESAKSEAESEASLRPSSDCTQHTSNITTQLTSADEELKKCVGSLRQSMLTIIRQRKQTS